MISETESVRNQTIEEWLLEYETGRKITPASVNQAKIQSGNSTTGQSKLAQSVYKYDYHKTTYSGSLVLVFTNIDTGEEVSAFFNVDTHRQRGNKKGKQHPTGMGGQFFPRPRSNFRKFWMTAVGHEPRRWSRVHKELKARLKGLLFTGNVTIGYDKHDRKYKKIRDLHILGTNVAHARHNSGTIQAQ